MKTPQEAAKEKKSAAYLWGYDCGKFGANKTNCHYTIFSTPENTKEWEQGKADAEKENKNQTLDL